MAPDLDLLERSLPGRDGLHVCQKLPHRLLSSELTRPAPLHNRKAPIIRCRSAKIGALHILQFLACPTFGADSMALYGLLISLRITAQRRIVGCSWRMTICHHQIL